MLTLNKDIISRDVHDDVVECGRELVKNVFLADIIARVKNNRITVKIINATENESTLPFSIGELQPLSEYAVCQFSHNEVDVDRVSNLLEELILNH